jgi:hypothetical protein
MKEHEEIFCLLCSMSQDNHFENDYFLQTFGYMMGDILLKFYEVGLKKVKIFSLIFFVLL